MLCFPGRTIFFVQCKVIQPLDNALIIMTILELIENFGDLLIGGKCMEDLLGKMVFGLELLDLLEQLLFRMFDMSLINTWEGSSPGSTSPARVITITLPDS
jgi:hypothetical protein